MASTSAQHHDGATASPSTPRAIRDWGRSGDPGSAFSGLSRGRGKGRGNAGGRVARGGRSGRAKSSADPSSDAPLTIKVDAPPTTDITSANSPALPPPPKSAPIVPSPMAKAKAASKRVPRNVPMLVLDPSSPTFSAPVTTATTARTPNRRSRSQQQHKPTSDKLNIPDSKPARARKSRSAVPPPLSSKDFPSHLSASAGPETATFDIRTDIDALVERVRAVAMAENRPTTPGSHIDWAGDEDDTLPDLDDWGVTTGTSPGTDMSPISVGGLTLLPEPDEQPFVVSDKTKQPANITIVPEINVIADRVDKTSPQALSEVTGRSGNCNAPRHKQSVEVHPDTTTYNDVIEPSFNKLPTDSASTVIRTEHYKPPLHPSLPPKPIAAVESLLTQSRPRALARSVDPPISVTSSTGIESLPVSVIIPSIKTDHHLKSDPENETQATLKQNPTSPDREFGTEQQPMGLSASIHAPRNYPESLSSPSHIPFDSPSTASHALRPTHHRSHTVGRSPQSTSFPAMISRSGYTTPHGRFSPSRNYHTRTHSSPADSSTIPRAPHVTRPIITGDALSRLARTICSTGVSPTRTMAVASSQD